MSNEGRMINRRNAELELRGAQAASLQVSAACRDREFPHCLRITFAKDVVGRVAGNYRLAASAPQNLRTQALLICLQRHAAFAVSMSSVYLPNRALLLHKAR